MFTKGYLAKFIPQVLQINTLHDNLDMCPVVQSTITREKVVPKDQ